MKKYITVFGPQELFAGAPEDCFCVAKNVYDENVYYKAVDARLFWFDGGKWKPLQFMSCTPIAMRRIIKTPVWTVADQKAGRLPEVGWVVRATGVNEDARIAAINNDAVCVMFEDGGFITLHVSGITPIETPAEKAQRERDEWKNNVIEIHHGKRRKMSTSTFLLDDIYDALLSGELQAPGVK